MFSRWDCIPNWTEHAYKVAGRYLSGREGGDGRRKGRCCTISSFYALKWPVGDKDGFGSVRQSVERRKFQVPDVIKFSYLHRLYLGALSWSVLELGVLLREVAWQRWSTTWRKQELWFFKAKISKITNFDEKNGKNYSRIFNNY